MQFPETCLFLFLQTKQNEENGLRPQEDAEQMMVENCNILKTNPAYKYKIVSNLGKGGQARIFKAQRISDEKIFAIKLM